VRGKICCRRSDHAAGERAECRVRGEGESVMRNLSEREK
jgi:hypothetical protein